MERARSTTNSGGTVSEVEFEVRDAKYPFVGASEAEACTFDLAEMVPRQDGEYAEFFNVTGTEVERVAERAEEYETLDATVLREWDGGGLVEFAVAGDCPAMSLAEHGALPRQVRSADGVGRITAEIPPPYEASTVIDSFLDDTPEAELASKRRVDSVTPIFSNVAFEEALRVYLTDRQREVLEAAFDAGYYEWPREATGEEVAEGLGITSATFSEHVHAAERRLFSALLSGSGDE
ncbi:bacterio-opsin activator domain-containing protein [Halosimplex pelagicum]|uniref:Helix-turn-helix domain-containing protein n=1 Tax=Halosimplex pelagicum TaxID=869886 RepID=A0A7D5THL7_9EURY|nr:bacterio-opsin activator domain-containing protein [Halosimplex pelagicum]QLH82976.1 helix-turn-helix domain-containing protein [Halosimplex pelagicum]